MSNEFLLGGDRDEFFDQPVEVVACEHLCILSDGKDKDGREGLVGLRDKSLAAFDDLLPRSAYATSSGVNARTFQKKCLIP